MDDEVQHNPTAILEDREKDILHWSNLQLPLGHCKGLSALLSHHRSKHTGRCYFDSAIQIITGNRTAAILSINYRGNC